MKTATPIAFRTVLLGSILALSQPVFSVGEPEFAARPVVSSLEADNPDVPATVHCGKTLVIPIVASDPDGQPLSYTVKTNKPWLLAKVRTGHPVMKMRVRSTNDGTGAPIDGTMEFALFRAETRDTAEFIAGFAQAPYYENVLFHRVIDDFVLQGGDPAGTGSGASPYVLPHEFKSHLIYSGRGQLAMANSSGGYSQSFPSYGRSFQGTNAFGFPDGTIEYITARTTPTNGSQFFITLGQPRHLDFKHTLFGQLLRGFDIMDKVAKVPVNASSRPNVNVTMSELSVRPSSSDAILYLSATNVGSATVTVTAEDVTGKKTSKTYAITSVKDVVNDPPFLAPLAPQVVPLGKTPSVASHAEDLESDRILTRIPVRVIRTFTTGAPTTTDTVYAGFTPGILDAVARPTIGAWDVTVGVSGANDPLVGSSDFDASRFQLLEVGVGDKVIGVEPVTLEAKEAVATPSSTIASFRYGGIVSSPSDFIASVNWGDGSALQASNGASPQVTIVPSISKPGYWDVKAAHTYLRAGVYPLHVTIDGPLGSTQTAKGYAVVAAETALFSALGEHHTVTGPTFANRPIAVISDITAGVNASDFDVVIDWGDGSRTTEGATVRHVGAGRYAIYASHRYADAERYSVMVTVTRAGFSSTAWSTLEIGGFSSPRYLPPFPKANLGSQWSESVRLGNQNVSGLPRKTISGARTTVTGYFSIFNSGEKQVRSPKLRFYLSNDNQLQKTGNGADTLLSIGPTTSSMKLIPLKSINSQDGGLLPIQNSNGLNLTIQLPLNETGTGKYLITDVDYSDPLTDNMPISKTVVFGPFQGINVTLPGSQTSLAVREGVSGTAGISATFTVVLDTLPTANVTIPIEAINLNNNFDESQVSISPSELVFTPQNGKIAQTVTVTAKNDTIREENVTNVIRLRPALSTDTRFLNMDASDVAVSIADDDSTSPYGIIASRASLTVTEGGASTSFTVRPSKAPTQASTMALEVVDSTGTIVTDQVSLSRTSISFPSGNANEVSVTVTATNDTVAESIANLTLRLKAVVSADTNFSGVDPADIPLTVIDNDQP